MRPGQSFSTPHPSAAAAMARAQRDEVQLQPEPVVRGVRRLNTTKTGYDQDGKQYWKTSPAEDVTKRKEINLGHNTKDPKPSYIPPATAAEQLDRHEQKKKHILTPVVHPLKQQENDILTYKLNTEPTQLHKDIKYYFDNFVNQTPITLDKIPQSQYVTFKQETDGINRTVQKLEFAHPFNINQTITTYSRDRLYSQYKLPEHKHENYHSIKWANLAFDITENAFVHDQTLQLVNGKSPHPNLKLQPASVTYKYTPYTSPPSNFEFMDFRILPSLAKPANIRIALIEELVHKGKMSLLGNAQVFGDSQAVRFICSAVHDCQPNRTHQFSCPHFGPSCFSGAIPDEWYVMSHIPGFAIHRIVFIFASINDILAGRQSGEIAASYLRFIQHLLSFHHVEHIYISTIIPAYSLSHCGNDSGSPGVRASQVSKFIRKEISQIPKVTVIDLEKRVCLHNKMTTVEMVCLPEKRMCDHGNQSRVAIISEPFPFSGYYQAYLYSPKRPDGVHLNLMGHEEIYSELSNYPVFGLTPRP